MFSFQRSAMSKKRDYIKTSFTLAKEILALMVEPLTHKRNFKAHNALKMFTRSQQSYVLLINDDCWLGKKARLKQVLEHKLSELFSSAT